MARNVASGQPRPLDELTVIVALTEIKEAALSKEMNSARDTWESGFNVTVTLGFSTGPQLVDRSWLTRERPLRRRASEVRLHRWQTVFLLLGLRR
jgi:hypothetical protein